MRSDNSYYCHTRAVISHEVAQFYQNPSSSKYLYCVHFDFSTVLHSEGSKYLPVYLFFYLIMFTKIVWWKAVWWTACLWRLSCFRIQYSGLFWLSCYKNETLRPQLAKENPLMKSNYNLLQHCLFVWANGQKQELRET